VILVPAGKESVAEAVGGLAVGFCGGLRADGEREYPVGVTEAGLGRLEIDALEGRSSGGAGSYVRVRPSRPEKHQVSASLRAALCVGTAFRARFPPPHPGSKESGSNPCRSALYALALRREMIGLTEESEQRCAGSFSRCS
jgi:hypothetical protein